jgi:hypothetical protein
LEEEEMQFSWKLVVATIVFAVCIAPTVVSYAPYSFWWDDSDYLCRSIGASKAFWSGDGHALRAAMVSIRPPIMTMLGVPWGPLKSWDAAGKCFLTLSTLSALFISCCLYFLLRVGLKPLYLVIASVCVFAALGPYPIGTDAHFFATGFMADSLFSWVAFAATLLIPYEWESPAASKTQSVWRGLLWGVIFAVGAITKVSFLYFIVLTIPILLFIRMRRSGLRGALTSLLSLSLCLLPVAIYWLRYGLTALKNGWAASFGHDAPLYHVPFSDFLIATIRQSPGILLPFLFAIAGIGYLIFQRRDFAFGESLIPLLITIGFCTISFASSNRQLRYSFVGIIAMPFLIGLLLSDKKCVVARGPASIASFLVFCCFVVASGPVLHRADRQSIAKSELVLGQVVESKAKRVMLGTDSASLNLSLLRLAIAVSPSLPPIETDTLAWHAANGYPIERDFREINDSNLVVFQNKEDLDLAFTNQRAAEYEQYIQQRFGEIPIKVVDGIRIYRVNND